MTKTSEWVSLGHPDKIADYISSCLLDRYLEHDPDTRYAVEVQIKDSHVTLGGEVTSAYAMTDGELRHHVRDAVCSIGYTESYLARWGEECAVSGDRLDVAIHIGRQSPDIARGVDRSGWGDQGIFWGMAVNDPETGFMPRDHWLAKRIGERITASGIGGLDVKTQVTLEDGEPRSIVVAVPLLRPEDTARVETLVRAVVGNAAEVIVNGTGRFVTHASMGDCGTTGRKLAVDLYGGNCRIGGGSPWTKDGTKADVALNLYARALALDCLKSRDLAEVHCAIASCIGRRDIRVTCFDGHMNPLETRTESRLPEDIIRQFRLREPRFAHLCRDGLFSDIA